jgi:hypothetical protein
VPSVATPCYPRHRIARSLMRRAVKYLSIAIGGLLLIPLFVLILMFVEGWVRRPLLYEFPAGFRGWYIIEFNRRDCPPLGRRAAYVVISIPPSGRLCTSSPMPKGWRYYRAVYVNTDGQHDDLDRSQFFRASTDRWHTTEDGFVGTREELNNTPSPPPPPDSHIPPWAR